MMRSLDDPNNSRSQPSGQGNPIPDIIANANIESGRK